MPGQYPKLILREEFDKCTAFEVLSKGWYSGATVKLENGFQYSVFFYDPVRLKQDLESEGKNYLSEPGLVVLSEVTPENMRRAILGLYEEGWFNALVPISKDT